MKKTVFIVVSAIVGTLLFTLTGVQIWQNYSGIHAEKQEESIQKQDIETVRKQTNDLFLQFTEGNVLEESDIVSLDQRYMKQVFNETVYPEPQAREQWLGMFGIGVFFEKQLEQGKGGKIIITALKGKIQSFEVTEVDEDKVHGTLTAYVSILLNNENVPSQHWIEWQRLPTEGWKISAVSFSGGIEGIKNPLSPKRR